MHCRDRARRGRSAAAGCRDAWSEFDRHSASRSFPPRWAVTASSCRLSARSLDVRAADHGGLAPAARMHVAERQRVAIELSVPEAVGVGEDEAPVVLAGEFADERFVGLLPAA